MRESSRPWHHRPAHVFLPNTMYMVTAGTLHKEHIYHDSLRLQLLHGALFQVAEAFAWKMQAWALFCNHYHFIAQSPAEAGTLKTMIQRFHSQTSRTVNQLDGTPGRKVWFQYWDTCLTYEKSYYVRLNYVHHNPVKHGLVSAATQYPYCSASWFVEHAEPSYRRKVESFRHEQANIRDDF